MSGLGELKASVSELEEILKRSSAIGDGDFRGNRAEIIAIRRRISLARTRIVNLTETSITSTELRGAFRMQFSEMCSAISIHQAAWPVVAIDVDDPAYIVSRDVTRASTRGFFAWWKTFLKVHENLSRSSGLSSDWQRRRIFRR